VRLEEGDEHPQRSAGSAGLSAGCFVFFLRIRRTTGGVLFCVEESRVDGVFFLFFFFKKKNVLFL